MITENPKDLKHIFGPVPSRRLGMSLGVDLMPHKTCSLDCIYCECGATTRLTIEREDYVSLNQIISELSAVLSTEPNLDYVTFSGSGEPTLHQGIGDAIRFLRTSYPKYQVAVLTNGTLFYREDVREQLRDADVIKVSLDCGSDAIFDRINRPCPGLHLAEIIDGLIRFRKRYLKQFWVEVFIIPGLNDTADELKKIKNIIKLLNPHKVQINAIDRPGTESWIKSQDMRQLKRISAYLCNAEIISSHGVDKATAMDYGGQRQFLSASQIPERILSTIKRRPCTIEDMSQQLGLRTDEIQYHLKALMKSRMILRKEMPRGIFYMIRL